LQAYQKIASQNIIEEKKLLIVILALVMVPNKQLKRILRERKYHESNHRPHLMLLIQIDGCYSVSGFKLFVKLVLVEYTKKILHTHAGTFKINERAVHTGTSELRSGSTMELQVNILRSINPFLDDKFLT
jgi:hypothetical protein